MRIGIGSTCVKLWAGVAVAVLAWARTGMAAEALMTNQATAYQTMALQALSYERAGDKQKALDAYEAIAKAFPDKQALVGNRIVNLCIELGSKRKALKWGERLAKDNPDPKSFLADVYVRVERYKDAIKILEKEVPDATPLRRKLTLMWQLGDAYERMGNPQKAEEVLSTAHTLSKGTPDELTALKRLSDMRLRVKPF
jgi:tetratricopeptide (TPR) repeat protein